jgi:Spx/MgsR family transcriptional regulator
MTKPSKLKVYEYAKCDTCRKALKFLGARGLAFDKTDITEKAPSKAELKAMLGYVGDIKKLFNTSGVVYKEMKLSEKVPSMKESEAIDLLASNGRLVKRPFVLGDGFGFVGFKEEEWKKRV